MEVRLEDRKRRKLSHATEIEEIDSDELVEGNAVEVSISHEPFAHHTSKASGIGNPFSSTTRQFIPLESPDKSASPDTEDHDHDKRATQAARSSINGSERLSMI